MKSAPGWYASRVQPLPGPLPAAQPADTSLYRAVLLASLACGLGLLLVAREPAPLAPHHTAVHAVASHAPRTATALALPRVQQISGVVQSIDRDRGDMVLRTGDTTYGIHLGSTSVSTTPCVAPSTVRPGQRVTVTVNAYLNGMLTALEIAPRAGAKAAPCAGR
jgi:hypothetical protein